MSDCPSQAQRLQKYLSRCGIASRRASEQLISAGRVQVNGHVCTELGTKVDPENDVVCVDGERVSARDSQITLMLHKPAGYVSTMTDPQGRPCVSELVPIDEHPSLYHLGRLDRDTSGLLLFSTDGELGNALVHPSRKVEKVYYAQVQGEPDENALRALREGVEIDGRLTAPARAELLMGEQLEKALSSMSLDTKGASGKMQAHEGKSAAKARKNASVLRIAIHEGRNRQVRKMCDAIGHPAIALHRQSFGPLDLGDLPRGSWRELDERELSALHQAVQ